MKLTKKLLAASMAGIMGASALGGTAVAVLNSGLVAFAAEAGDVTEIASYTGSAAINNGDITVNSSNTTKLFYMGTSAPANTSIGAKLTTNAEPAEGDKFAYKVGDGTVTDTAIPVPATAGATDVKIDLTSALSGSGATNITFGIIASGGSDFKDSSQQVLAVTPTKVEFTANTDDFTDEIVVNSAVPSEDNTVQLEVENINHLVFGAAPDATIKQTATAGGSSVLDGSANGLSVSVDTHGVVTISGTPTQAGKYTVSVMSKNIDEQSLTLFETETASTGAEVAGFTKNVELATFTIDVAPIKADIEFATASDVIALERNSEVSLTLPSINDNHFTWGDITKQKSSSTTTDIDASISNGVITIKATKDLTANDTYTVTVPVKVANTQDANNYSPNSKSLVITLTANDTHTVTVTASDATLTANINSSPAATLTIENSGNYDGKATLSGLTKFNNVVGKDNAVSENDIRYTMTHTGVYNAETRGYDWTALENPVPVNAPIKIGKYTASLTYGTGESAPTISVAGLENWDDRTPQAPSAQDGAGPSTINANGEAGSIERILSAYKIDLGSIKNLFSAGDFTGTKLNATIQKIATENDITSEEAFNVFITSLGLNMEETNNLGFLVRLILALFL